MRCAVTILSLVAVIAAEAPYNLPRPAVSLPAFNYPTQPAPSPSPPSPRPSPQPRPIQTQYQQQQYVQNGYQYQQPNIAPAFIQSAPQSPPHQQTYYQPTSQRLPVSYSQPQAIIQQPQPIVPLPSVLYGSPQPQIVSRPAPIRPLSAYAAPQPLLQPQLQSQQSYQPISYYQQQQLNSQQGYAYQQPRIQSAQFAAQLPLQSQPLSSNNIAGSLSSYQVDSTLYSGGQAQVQSEGLDETVVNHVQNIVKEHEHSSARNSGYQSLVSGVSLEGVQPSIEISSFVQNSPLATGRSLTTPDTSQLNTSEQTSSAISVSAPSVDYGLPTIAANSQSSQSDISTNFLPQSKPSNSYGTP